LVAILGIESVLCQSLLVRQKPGLAGHYGFIHLRAMPASTISKLMRLPARQRLAIAERLWLSVADEARMPVPDEHKRILRKRLADYRAGRTKAISHEELMRRLQSS
jgi:putative addiction module component (TIGR02574 family)